jgi:hypothetical protein
MRSSSGHSQSSPIHGSTQTGMMRCSSRIKQRPSPLPETPKTSRPTPSRLQSSPSPAATNLASGTLHLDSLLEIPIHDPTHCQMSRYLSMHPPIPHFSIIYYSHLLIPIHETLINAHTSPRPSPTTHHHPRLTHSDNSATPSIPSAKRRDAELDVRGGEWSRLSELCRGKLQRSGSRAWGEPRHTFMSLLHTRM